MNIRLQTNVLCVKADGRWVLSEKQIAGKLSYFHLVELSRANPIKFPYTFHDRDNLTHRQELQKRAFLRERMTHLWDTSPGMSPLPGSKVRNPFEARETTESREAVLSAKPSTKAKVERERSTIPSQTQAPRPKRDEQAEVIHAAPDADIFVVAPPGTGKTHVLVERLAHLIVNGHCQSPAEEILVLSFTRSAVAEVRRRLLSKIEQGAHPDVLYARVLTFDSLATRAILLDRQPEFLAGRDYSDRIRLFVELLPGRLPRAREELGKVRYLFVDEVQDLSGHRAAMVLGLARLVKESGGAVCFLGDPAQAIYDFDEGAAEILASTEFLKQLAAGGYGGAPPTQAHFENYRRFETAEMLGFVAKARNAMGPDGLHPDGVQLAGLLSDLGPRQLLEQLHEWAQTPGTKAILARTNLEAYQIWTWCERQEINAELWRGSSGSYWPAWIARLVLGFRQESMPLYVLEERWRESVGPFTRTSLGDATALLQREGVLADGRLDLVRLNHVISSGSPTAERKPDSTVTISTIHRSKGLEFDEVLLYSSRDNFAGTDLDVRVVYVAATRAKKRFRVLDRSELIKRGVRNGGALRTSHFHIRLQNNNIGLVLDGIDEADDRLWLEEPAEEARDCANFLWQQGASQIPRAVEIVDGHRSSPDLVLGERRIGGVAASVHADLERIARVYSTRFDRCTGLHMVDVAAAAFDPEDKRAREAFGAACLGISPVISGIGTVRTKKL
jgi:hypothetical protein